ncbi:hypothetical protein HFO93_04865 [Rhizobium leguminosarum]|uniref:hypothetical protein n=1 Tax=Rhizobium leguminosarum TaxID=384 RepID=UPI001C951FC2|nr:hypothetical protein [Rhizobium leguminosarum]MBY5442813.1 hypothetical protein [Rhizobium leguminosarum]
MNDEDKLKADVFWKMYSEHCVQGRHHETQRSTVIGVTLAVAAALVGIATFDRALGGILDIAVSVFLIFLGLFGAGFSMKHYERSKIHMERARGYRDALDAMLSGRPIQTIKAIADATHGNKFPKMQKWRLHYWWIALNSAISVLGVALLIVAAIFPVSPPPQ